MPHSPFPGMDPFLEHPSQWPNLHQSLITYLRDTLNEKLPPGYIAAAEERLYVDRTARPFYPDVAVSQRRPPDGEARGNRTILTAEADEAWEVPLETKVVREPFIQIFSPRPDRRIVTVIEILSPANKRPGGEGHREYLAKQDEVIRGRVSLLELDLLRGGEHTVAAPLEDLRTRGKWTYLACLSDAIRSGSCSVWPIGLRDPLPRVRVPLEDGDTPVVVALQPILERAYMTGRFDEILDYREPPPPPLSPEDGAWVAERLREFAAGK